MDGIWNWILIGVVIGVPALGSIYASTRRFRMRKRAQRVIGLDRIARIADVGINQLQIWVSEGQLVGTGSGPMRRRWRVSVQFMANDGGPSTGDVVEMKLDDTDNGREIEDKIIRLIQNRHMQVA